jgi:hypothetical protein
VGLDAEVVRRSGRMEMKMYSTSQSVTTFPAPQCSAHYCSQGLLCRRKRSVTLTLRVAMSGTCTERTVAVQPLLHGQPIGSPCCKSKGNKNASWAFTHCPYLSHSRTPPASEQNPAVNFIRDVRGSNVDPDVVCPRRSFSCVSSLCPSK